MARRRSSEITSLAYNQDQGCFTCCLTSGLRVYNVDPLVEKAHYSRDEVGEVSMCEMIFRTNWLLIVKARRPNTIVLLDDQVRMYQAEIKFQAPIRALRARRDKVAVVLQSSVHVLSLPTFQRVMLVRMPANTRPLCAIATDPAAPHILAVPAHRKGAIQLIDVTRAVKGAESSSPVVIGCHQNDLVCICLSANGAKLATASTRGTIIRLWDTNTKQMLHELRRGSDYADVYCINFNPTASLVCCMSDKGTLHVWRASQGSAGPSSAASTSSAASSSSTASTSSTAGRAPEHVTASVRPDTRALCALPGDTTATVICEDGTFHKFTFSPEGSCHRSEFDYFLQVGDDDEFLQ